MMRPKSSAHCLRHLLGRDAKGFQCLRVQVNVDFALGGAHQVHRAHAAHVLQAFFERLFGPAAQFDRAALRHAFCSIWQHRQRPHRAAGRVKAQHARLFHLVAQQRAHAGHFFAHVLCRLAAIDVQLEFNDDDRAAFKAS